MGENELWVILGAFLVYLITVLMFGIVGIAAFKGSSAGTAKSFRLMFSEGNLLRMLTVMFIVLAVVWLSSLKVLEQQGTIALLSGVVGYVLGGLGQISQPHKSVDKPD